MRGFYRIFLLILALLIYAIPAFAEDEDKGPLKLSYASDRWIALHYFMQTQIFTQNGYENSGSDNWTKSCDLRRSRIILNGQVTKDIDFFMDTEDFLVGNQGAGSQYSTTSTSTDGSNTVKTKDTKGLYTQDAYINYKVNQEAFQVVVGLMPIPFMHQNMESPISLLGVDYNTMVIPLSTTSNNWRDTGIEIKGLYKVIEYRLGVFRGQPRYISSSDSTGAGNENPDAWPRFSGRIQLNFLEAETGFFYSGNYLGKKNIASIGIGVDYMHNGARKEGTVHDYFAITADATFDIKVSDDLVTTFQGGWLKVKNEPGTNTGSESGYYGQLGLLFYGVFQPVIKYQYWEGFNFADGGNIKTAYISGGANYFINGHTANIKFEYQNPIFYQHHISGEKKAVLQFQIFI